MLWIGSFLKVNYNVESSHVSELFVSSSVRICYSVSESYHANFYNILNFGIGKEEEGMDFKIYLGNKIQRICVF